MQPAYLVARRRFNNQTETKIEFGIPPERNYRYIINAEDIKSEECGKAASKGTKERLMVTGRCVEDEAMMDGRWKIHVRNGDRVKTFGLISIMH